MSYLTYEQLGQLIAQMPDEVKKRPAQILPPAFETDHERGLLPVAAFDTVGALLGPPTDEEPVVARSAYDNEYVPEDYVILTDFNPFFMDGSYYDTLMSPGDESNDTNDVTDSSSHVDDSGIVGTIVDHPGPILFAPEQS